MAFSPKAPRNPRDLLHLIGTVESWGSVDGLADGRPRGQRLDRGHSYAQATRLDVVALPQRPAAVRAVEDGICSGLRETGAPQPSDGQQTTACGVDLLVRCSRASPGHAALAPPPGQPRRCEAGPVSSMARPVFEMQPRIEPLQPGNDEEPQIEDRTRANERKMRPRRENPGLEHRAYRPYKEIIVYTTIEKWQPTTLRLSHGRMRTELITTSRRGRSRKAAQQCHCEE